MDAKEQLFNGAGTQFDAGIIDVFVREIIGNADELMKEIETTYLIRAQAVKYKKTIWVGVEISDI